MKKNYQSIEVYVEELKDITGKEVTASKGTIQIHYGREPTYLDLQKLDKAGYKPYANSKTPHITTIFLSQQELYSK